MHKSKRTFIDCLKGNSAGRHVLLGFAPAHILHQISFADILDEETGKGYQRRFNAQHSLDFRKYIQRSGSTTIPLTFNLRPEASDSWNIREVGAARCRLGVIAGARVLAQVDCQHRLGHLTDVAAILPFMCFIGLSQHEEMEIFNVINSKARGLNTSLLDFHAAQLSTDVSSERPELFVALFLRNNERSPWYQQLDLGGATTSGMARRASLRTVQKAVKRFLGKTRLLQTHSPGEVAEVVLEFWAAIVATMPEAWKNPRKHLVTKGIGVYALMDLAAELVCEMPAGRTCDRYYFGGALSDFVNDFDWSTDGPLKGLGGEGGVKSAVALIRQARQRVRLRVVANG